MSTSAGIRSSDRVCIEKTGACAVALAPVARPHSRCRLRPNDNPTACDTQQRSLRECVGRPVDGRALQWSTYVRAGCIAAAARRTVGGRKSCSTFSNCGSFLQVAVRTRQRNISLRQRYPANIR